MHLPSTSALSGLLAAALLLPGAAAWGSLGHITVAYVAQDFVGPATEAYLQGLLRNDTDSYLAGVATWADSIRYTKWGHFTGVFHFIDAKDSPPAECGIDMERDCKAEGCIVTAFANYTARALAVSSLPAWQRAQAAKFVVHFAGDVHQPLHDEDVARGGNGIHVLWEGKELNLHHVWDSSIAEKPLGGRARRPKPYEAARAWASSLTAEIRAGRYAAESAAWLDGVDDVADAEATVLRWAREGNAYVCSHVFSPHGPKDIVGQELSGDYYEKAAPVIEVQVARAGYRLARWLDLMVESLHHSGDIGEL